MRAKRVIAIFVLGLVAFLIVYPPLANSSVKVAVTPSSGVAVEHLYVTVEEISAHRADTREPEGWFLLSNQSSVIDLAMLNSTQTTSLGSLSLGQYDMIRIRVTNATAFVNNTSKSVQLQLGVFTVPSSFTVRLGQQTAVVLNVTPDLEITPEKLTLDLSFASTSEK